MQYLTSFALLPFKHANTTRRSSFHSRDLQVKSAFNRFFEIPLDTNKRFVQRPHLLSQLEEKFGFQKDATRGKERVALTGMGGARKTEIAVYFAELHRYEYEAIFWLDGSSNIQMMVNFQSIADTISSDKTIEPGLALSFCRKWFVNHHKWLLIVDNLDETSVIEMSRDTFLNAGEGGSQGRYTGCGNSQVVR